MYAALKRAGGAALSAPVLLLRVLEYLGQTPPQGKKKFNAAVGELVMLLQAMSTIAPTVSVCCGRRGITASARWLAEAKGACARSKEMVAAAQGALRLADTAIGVAERSLMNLRADPPQASNGAPRASRNVQPRYAFTNANTFTPPVVPAAAAVAPRADANQLDANAKAMLDACGGYGELTAAGYAALAFAVSLLPSPYAPTATARDHLVDLGSGNGSLLAVLHTIFDGCDVTGLEKCAERHRYAKRRLLALVHGDGRRRRPQSVPCDITTAALNLDELSLRDGSAAPATHVFMYDRVFNTPMLELIGGLLKRSTKVRVVVTFAAAGFDNGRGWNGSLGEAGFARYDDWATRCGYPDKLLRATRAERTHSPSTFSVWVRQ